ncbi:hypothetical protein HKD37_18G051148 [Glycine soja]
MKEMKREKHVSYSSHNSCKSLSEELRDYYEGRHRSHLRPHSHRRENERKPQEVNIKLLYFHGKDNVKANIDWEIRVEQQLKRKSTSKSYGSHSYQKKDQGQGILGVRPSKPKDDKGKTIEKQPLKASMQEKTSSMKCFKCLGRGHITSQCPTKKTMIMRGQDIYSSQDEATTSPSSSKSEEAKGEESSEEIYPQEEGQPLMVKEGCKEVSVSSKRLAKKERHFEIKTNIKEISLLRQPPHFLLCKKTLVSIATSLRLEFNPQVKELLDEGLVRKRLNPCALLVPKIGVEEKSPTFQEPRDLRSNPFQGGGNDAILPHLNVWKPVEHSSDAKLAGESDPLGELMKILFYVYQNPVEVSWEASQFGLPDIGETISGDKCLNIVILQLWTIFMNECGRSIADQSLYGLLEPQSIQNAKERRQQCQQYIETWVKESQRQLYLGAYLHQAHWQLFVLHPRENTVVWFCSLRKKPDINIKGAINSAMKTITSSFEGMSNQGAPRWVEPNSIVTAGLKDDWHKWFSDGSPLDVEVITTVR